MTDLQIRCFLTVASKLNFSEAAKELFISQSNASRQIALLEEELGFDLFNRSTKSVKLTPAGHILYEKLQDLVREWEVALEDAMNISKEDEGHLTIGCTPWEMSNSMLSQLLFDFQKQHPNVTINKIRAGQDILINGLRSGYFDAILIANHDVCQLSGMNQMTLYYNPLCIIIHKNHPLFKKRTVEISDLSDSKFLRYKPDNIPKDEDYLYQACRHSGFEPNVILEYENFEEFLYATEAGHGVSIICEESAQQSNPNIKVVRIESEPMKRMDMKITSKDNNPNKTLKKLLDFVEIFSKEYLD
jgi:DNA-binding transcriptional LysR family regulator